MSEIDIKEVVRERYAEAARNVRASGSYCGGSACGDGAALAGASPITSNLYTAEETGALRGRAILQSNAC